MMVARSSLECRLYIELHPCTCGRSCGELKHRLRSAEQGLVAVYEGECAACARVLSFIFLLGDEIAPAAEFGGAQPSSIIDAAQFMREADRLAKLVPLDSRDGSGSQRVSLLTRTIACVQEVLKWYGDGTQLPESAVFTEDGRAFFNEEPARFRLSRVRALLAAYQEARARLRT